MTHPMERQRTTFEIAIACMGQILYERSDDPTTMEHLGTTEEIDNARKVLLSARGLSSDSRWDVFFAGEDCTHGDFDD